MDYVNGVINSNPVWTIHMYNSALIKLCMRLNPGQRSNIVYIYLWLVLIHMVLLHILIYSLLLFLLLLLLYIVFYFPGIFLWVGLDHFSKKKRNINNLINQRYLDTLAFTLCFSGWNEAKIHLFNFVFPRFCNFVSPPPPHIDGLC